jgi:hypothetical protein
MILCEGGQLEQQQMLLALGSYICIYILRYLDMYLNINKNAYIDDSVRRRPARAAAIAASSKNLSRSAVEEEDEEVGAAAGMYLCIHIYTSVNKHVCCWYVYMYIRL